jgi:hypothetical protein
MGAIVSVDGDVWPTENPMIISGHIHSKQWVQDNIYYTGSALQHAFGESENNTVAIMTLKHDRQFELIEQDLGLPKKKIVYTSIDNVQKAMVKAETAGTDNIKLTITGTDYSEFKAFKKTETYRQLLDSGTKVVFKTQKVETNERSTENELDFKTVLYDLCKVDDELVRLYNVVVNDTDTIEVQF